MSDPVAITATVVGFFALLALLAVLRIVLRRTAGDETWRRWRVGVFVERDVDRRRERDEPESGDRRERG